MITSMVKIACQAIVYGNPVIRDTIADIVKNIKEIGYDGLEVGARHFDMEKPEFYADLFGSLGLNLIAVHIGGDFLNRDSVGEQLDNAGKTAAFAKKLGSRYIYLSGTYREGKTREDYIHEAKTYTEIGKRCADQGLALCYHNHFWEFEHNMVGMNILLDNVPETLMKLVPDVGWVKISDMSPVKFLKDNIDRVEALHFKDFKGWKQFAELGTGIVPFPAVYDLIRDDDREWWITAEQDETALSPQEAAAMNYRYIAGLAQS